MKICDLFQTLEEMDHPALSQPVLLRFLSECENSILTDIYLASAEDCIEYTAVTDAELLVPHPFDKLYLPYLQAKVAYAAGEFRQYQNHMELYNEFRDDFAKYLLTAVHPGNGLALKDG